MDRQKLEALQSQFTQITSRYDAGFAGKARATRDVSLLDAIISDLDSLIEDAQTLMNGDNSELIKLLDDARESSRLYHEEREQIVRIQTTGPEVVEGAMLATWANFVFDEYQRYFAGQSRSSRDLSRLEEMIAELEGIREDMQRLLKKKPDFQGTVQDLQVVESNIKMYEGEVDNILQAFRAGTRDERISNLANRANEQFRIYREQFAGKGRTTRRPDLLKRMIKNLNGILTEMREINSKGARNETNTKNITIVQDNLKMYRDELEQVQRARNETTMEDLASMLGGAANDAMAEYGKHFAGQSRATRSLELMNSIIDELYELALQMREVQDAAPNMEFNSKNLRIVIDTLQLYQAEYKRIKEAKGLT